MALPVIFSPEADARLGALQDYLSERFYPERSARFVYRLILKCMSIGSFPEQGKRREDVRPGARTTSFERKITILFQVQAQQVVILDIFYGGREVLAE